MDDTRPATFIDHDLSLTVALGKRCREVGIIDPDGIFDLVRLAAAEGLVFTLRACGLTLERIEELAE